jgi:hypothetical protein
MENVFVCELCLGLARFRSRNQTDTGPVARCFEDGWIAPQVVGHSEPRRALALSCSRQVFPDEAETILHESKVPRVAGAVHLDEKWVSRKVASAR